ncbi:MAG: O-antigen ligase family protein [Desertimonas sp.]
MPVLRRIPWGAVVETLVVAIVSLSLTLGPVYQFRLRWPTTVDLASDPLVLSWLGLMHLAALLLVVIRRPDLVRVGRPPLVGITALAILVAAIVVSTVWSFAPVVTATAALGIAATAVTGLALMATVAPARLLIGAAIGLHVGVAWSGYRIWRGMLGALDAEGNWVGVYFNRNSLAPVTAMALLLAGVATMLAVRATPARRWRPAIIAAGVGAGLVDLRLYLGTGSRTSALAIGVAVAVVAGLAVARSRAAAAQTDRVVMLGGAVVVGVGIVVGVARAMFVGAFDVSATLTSRTGVWSVALEWWARRPLRGWGYLGLWGRNVDFTLDLYATNDGVAATSAHNSLIEVLLGAGVVAAVALVIVVALGWWVVARLVLTGDVLVCSGIAAMWSFVVVLNVTETFVIANSWYLAVLVGVLAMPWRADLTSRRGRPVDDAPVAATC